MFLYTYQIPKCCNSAVLATQAQITQGKQTLEEFLDQTCNSVRPTDSAAKLGNKSNKKMVDRDKFNMSFFLSQ